MGNMFFDIILQPMFSAFVLITFIAAVAALIIARRQKQLSSGLKGILFVVIALCALYLIFFVSLVFLFNSAPPAPPTPTVS